MGKSQRTKGAAYEREVAHKLTEALGIPGFKVERNIEQVRDGGNDLNVGSIKIECKRRKTLTTVATWLAQAERATDRKSGQLPIVVARADAGQSLVVLSLDDFLTLTVDELRARVEATL